MKLETPVFLNEIGNRSNNEDAVYPKVPNKKSNLFLVCDGVGGQNKGEEASSIACEAFSEYAGKNKKVILESVWINNGLRHVESRMKKYLDKHPESAGMATTLTVMYLLREMNKVVIGWVGDSRVYHIRDGEILFQTKDHSLVQSMVDMQEITKEEAEYHPKRNIITRAVKGTEPTQIDVKIINDVQPNDYFFMCTDGILENTGEKEISEWFLKDEEVKKIKEKIVENSAGKTQDNFSMYLLKIKKVNDLKGSMSGKKLRRKNAVRKGSFLILILILMLILVYVFSIQNVF